MNETKPVEGTHGCRAPVNGLVIGAIVGAVLALVFLLPYFGSLCLFFLLRVFSLLC